VVVVVVVVGGVVEVVEELGFGLDEVLTEVLLVTDVTEVDVVDVVAGGVLVSMVLEKERVELRVVGCDEVGVDEDAAGRPDSIRAMVPIEAITMTPMTADESSRLSKPLPTKAPLSVP